jgi:hypothetical protein
MQTRKTTIGTTTKMPASMANLRGIVRLDLDKFNSLSFSLILDETLQLEERPVANPIVQYPSPIGFSNSFEVLHYYLASVKLGNNVFTDVVVYPSHPTSFSSRDFLEQSLAGTSAFTLKLGTQIFELPFDLLDFGRIIKPAVRTDGEVVYSEVNAQNGMLRATSLLSGINLFRECEQKEASSFFIQSQKAFRDFPIKIFSIAFRNIQFELLPAIQQSQDENISFEVSTSGEIIPDGSSFYEWASLSFLDQSTSLLHASDCYLGGKLETLSDCLVDSVMQFEVLSDFVLPSVINTELQRFSVSLDSSNKFLGWINPDFCSDSCSHSDCNSEQVFKTIGGEFAFPPKAKAIGYPSEHVL